MAQEQPDKNTLYNKIGDILNKDWNPMGESKSAGVEYETYIPEMLELKKSGASAETIAHKLHKIEIDQMGFPGSLMHCRHAADKIIDLPDFFA